MCPGTGQKCGTIQSYCHTISGGMGNIGLTFGGSVKTNGKEYRYGKNPLRIPQMMKSRISSTTCNEVLTPYLCGNNVIDAADGETCDPPDGGVTCRADCTAVECGDDIVDTVAGEECDDVRVMQTLCCARR